MHGFKLLQQILVKLDIFTKFGMINRTVRHIYCLNKRSRSHN